MELLDDDMLNEPEQQPPTGLKKWLPTLLEGIPLGIIIFGLFVRYRRMTGNSTFGLTPEFIIAIGASLAAVVYLLFTQILFPRITNTLLDTIVEYSFRIAMFIFMIWLGLSFYGLELPSIILIIGGISALVCAIGGGIVVTQASERSARREWSLKLVSRALAVSFLIFIMT